MRKDMILEIYKNKKDKNPIVFGGNFFFKKEDNLIGVYNPNSELIVARPCRELSYNVGGSMVYAYGAL